MASVVVDLQGERREIERALFHARRERDREARRLRTGEATRDEVDVLNAKIRRLEDEMAELDGVAALEQEDRVRRQEAELAQRRQIDTEAFAATAAAAVSLARRIDDQTPLSQLGPVVTQLFELCERAQRLWTGWVADDGRKTDVRDSIRRVVGAGKIEDWLEGAAHRARLVRGPAPIAELCFADMTLGDLVAGQMEMALKQAQSEFPGLSATVEGTGNV